jgi:hypothetical protein
VHNLSVPHTTLIQNVNTDVDLDREGIIQVHFCIIQPRTKNTPPSLGIEGWIWWLGRLGDIIEAEEVSPALGCVGRDGSKIRIPDKGLSLFSFFSFDGDIIPFISNRDEWVSVSSSSSPCTPYNAGSFVKLSMEGRYLVLGTW